MDATKIRATAAKSALLCSGAGFALIGKGRFAIATFVSTVFLLPAVEALTFWPTALFLAMALTVFLVAIGLGIYEHVAIQRATLAPFQGEGGRGGLLLTILRFSDMFRIY